MDRNPEIAIDMDDEFARKLLALAPAIAPTEPSTFYNPDGDCIEFISGNESYYAERIDGLVTVYYGRESGAIVGSLIKGVKRFCRDFGRESPGFLIDVEDGPVLLSHLITAGMWKQGDPIIYRKYKKLRETAERFGVKVMIPELAGQ